LAGACPAHSAQLMAAICDRFGPFVELQLNEVRLGFATGLRIGLVLGSVLRLL